MSENIFVRRIGVKSEARIREWIKALVSGNFKQAEGVLREEATGGYCCLGVICQIAEPDGWNYVGIPHFGHPMGAEAERNGYLNQKAARSYNLSAAGQKKLAKLNDSGYNFGEVAVFIAEQLGAKLAVQA